MMEWYTFLLPMMEAPYFCFSIGKLINKTFVTYAINFVANVCDTFLLRTPFHALDPKMFARMDGNYPVYTTFLAIAGCFSMLQKESTGRPISLLIDVDYSMHFLSSPSFLGSRELSGRGRKEKERRAYFLAYHPH